MEFKWWNKVVPTTDTWLLPDDLVQTLDLKNSKSEHNFPPTPDSLERDVFVQYTDTTIVIPPPVWGITVKMECDLIWQISLYRIRQLPCLLKF